MCGIEYVLNILFSFVNFFIYNTFFPLFDFCDNCTSKCEFVCGFSYFYIFYYCIFKACLFILRTGTEDCAFYKCVFKVRFHEAAFFKTAAGYAEKYDVKIAIEPLRLQECNILNLVSEATQMAAWVDSDHVGVLADTFHMLASHEPWEAMEKAGDKLWHVHISSPLPDMSSRVFPYAGDGSDYAAVFKVLFQAGYQGNVSVEAGAADFAADAKKAAALLNSFV